MPVKRGEVYFIDLAPTMGREQAGRRPVVVVSNNILNSQPLVVVVVPGTKRSRAPVSYQWNVCVPAGEASLIFETVFLTFQVRAIDHSRFQEAPCGVLSSMFVEQLDRTLAWTLALRADSVPPSP